MGNLDTALKDADSAMFNPPVREPNKFSKRQLELMTDDMVDRLLTNTQMIGDMIYGDLPYDGKELSLNCSQARDLSVCISNLLTCRRDDLDEHVENLRNMFAGNLQPMAESMASEFLENGEED